MDVPGGIERASVNLANLFAENGHAVTILILDFTTELFYQLHPSVKVVQKHLHFGITAQGNFLSRKAQFIVHLVKLKRIYKGLHPDIIISTEYSLTIPSWFATKGLTAKLLAWEHHHFHWIEKNRFWDMLFRFTYPRLKTVVCQNTTEKQLYEKMNCTAVAIPYVIPQQQNTALLNEKNILSIGWLIKRKGIDLLPDVAKLVFKEHPDWTWKIIGEGEEYNNVTAALKKNGLQKNVIIQKPGSPDIQQEYLQASIFVMLSRFECLPLVMLEATTFGLPLVAFNCPTGPADIIHNNEDGYLVVPGEVDEMAAKINLLIEDKDKRKQFGYRSYQNSARYSGDTIYKKWMELFQRL